MNVLQGDIEKGDSSAKVGCVRHDEQPVKKLRTDTDVQPTKSSHVQPVNVDDCVKTTDWESSSLFVDLTASDDTELLPQSRLLNERLSSSEHLPVFPAEARELCRSYDNHSCVEPLRVFSDSCTVSPPESPELPTNDDVICPQQSVNGVCDDVASLKMQYRNAAVTGCHDITDELMSDCHNDDVVQSSRFPSLDQQVAAVVVNGGNIAQDCSCSI